MDAATVVLILVAVGVNFGWQPAEEAADGLEYIVQVEPELLDTLERGEGLPIESNVPPDVGPIRKISVVVGRGDLPRTTAAAVNRTSRFAGESAWAPGQYNPAPPPAASAYDRYGPLPGTSNTGVGPPPSVLDRAQLAASETASTLRDGVEAGIQAANQQLSRSGEQVFDATRNASQQIGRRLQDFASDPAGQLQSTTNDLRMATERALGTAGNPSQPISNPFANASSQPPASSAPPASGSRAPANVGPPPWPAASAGATGESARQPNPIGQSADATASPGMTPRQTATGWTTIGSNVAPPPLLIPRLDTAPPLKNTASNQPSVRGPSAASEGPRFPERPPAAPQSTATDDWASGWGTDSPASQATISRNGVTPTIGSLDRNSGLVPIQPITPGAENSQSKGSGTDDLWAEADRWNQPPQVAAAPATVQGETNPTITGNDATDWQLGGRRPPVQSPNSPANETQPGEVVNSAGPAAPAALNQASPLAAADQPPWLPLLVVSLSLMGSLSANLFLGWSYMDARQKYRSLVRKTADTFRRATSAAA